MTIIPEKLAIHKPKKELIEKIDKTEIKEKVLYQVESCFHTISVVQNSFGKFIKYLDTYQAGYIDSSYYQGNLPYINYFLLSYLINPKIEKILLVGLGSGIILKQFKQIFDNLKQIDVVDIEEYIFPIAEKYFNFDLKNKCNFYLQDALIHLKETKQKYDLIIVDVAGDEGIDERFTTCEYLNLIKKHLKKDGIFISNMPSSSDVLNKKNKFVLDLIKKYQDNFNYLELFNGKTSNKIFYKVFFDIDEDVLDITNLIMIASNKKISFSNDFSKIKKLNINIEEYLKDKI